MHYKLIIADADVFGKAKFANDKGNTECRFFLGRLTLQRWIERPKGTKRSNDADTFYVIK